MLCLYYVKKSWNEQLPIKLKVLIYTCTKWLGTLKSAYKNDDSQNGLEIIVIIESAISICVQVDRVNNVLVVSNNKLQ